MRAERPGRPAARSEEAAPIDIARSDSLEPALRRLREDPRVALAERLLRQEDGRTIEAQIELSEIPAPPFGEQARGRRMAELLRQAGLEDVGSDSIGNVIGHRAPSAAGDGAHGGPLVVSAHLDTVFPPGTDVRVSRRGDVLRGPGISDDARGLATLLALARGLHASDVRTRTPLLFVATVGEEGPGDLRGVKHLFGEQGAARGAVGFVSLDGAGIERIVVRGLGARRFRISARGPGGHSWVDWGTPNPIHVLSGLAARLVSLPSDDEPVTTLTIARWGGGKSINAIPQEAWIELDTRGERDALLDALEADIRRVVAEAGSAAPSAIELCVEPIGHRPGGTTAIDTELVRAAVAATRAAGAEVELALSSTDGNIPMALGIPTITLGCGGEGGKAHTTDEWFRNSRGVEGVVRALHTVLLAAGLDE